MLLIVLGLVSLALGGCQYTTRVLYPDQYQTVAVPIFENRTFYQGVNADLAEALVKQIEQQTPYKVSAPPTADTILQGTITHISQEQLTRRRKGGGVPQELEITITVDFEWKDLRTGKPIRDRKGFRAVGRYIPTEPYREPVDIGLSQAVDRLATDIISVFQADW